MTEATNIKFGIKAGVSSANNKWSDDVGDEKSITKPTFGAFAVFELSPTLAIQPEINFLVTGEWWDFTGGKEIENFTYLHIPILLKARLMKEGKFIPVVFAGPVISFLLSATEEVELTDGTSDSFDAKEFYKSTDFGLDFGAGGEFALGKMKALIDLRYYMGLTNVYSAPPIMMAAPMEFTMKNAAFMLTAGIIF